LGPRTTDFQTYAQRAVLGVQGTWSDWSYDAGYLYSENIAHTTYVSGFVSASGLNAAMATGLINPFGPSGAAGNALLASTEVSGEVRRARATVNQIDAHASRDLFDMAGGAAALALGAEARREQLADNPGALLASGDFIGAGQPIPPTRASRNVYAVFAETILPVSTTIEAQLSARYDHYSDFGGTTNPKLALRWQPLQTFLVRGSVGTGFRAPALPEVYTPRYSVLSETQHASDPVRCPVTGADADCYPEFFAIDGGNPALQPEKSTQYTAGVVWEPLHGSSLSVTYWNIDKRNTISLLDPDYILSNYGFFGSTDVIRGPVDPAYPNLPGPITAINTYLQNIGKVHTTGVDLDVVAHSPVTSLGQLSLRLDGTFVTLYEVTLPGTPAQSSLGGYGVDGPVPRWKHYGALTWTQGPWSATAGQTFQTGYTDENPFDGSSRRVGSYSLWDLQASYTGLRNLTLTAGIHNLFNRDPPASNQTAEQQRGYDPLYGDPRGASYYVTLHYAFK
jgi:iron complex outermembrane receptor protein